VSFAVRSYAQPGVTGLDATIFQLDDGAGGRADVWPALGFNCFRWQVQRAGTSLDLLYADPDLFHNSRPTRSGIPILFPFPNRIRDGRYTWDGKSYQLPLNDPTQLNAIHGFACRRPWRVAGQGADAGSAWVVGTFRGSDDAPDCKDLWPADYEIRVTYRLGGGSLRIEAVVHNPDNKPLPFGLGYHPYFRLPFNPAVRPEDCLVTVPARSFWVLGASLPSGIRRPVDADRDLNQPRPFPTLNLDDILTDLPATPPGADGLHERAVLRGAPGADLRLLCSDAFHELVVFTPPHRRAFCAEPYTCITDAINLQQRGVEAGLLVLPPGGRWTSVVELRI
jgi:aldose 1-epimerase